MEKLRFKKGAAMFEFFGKKKEEARKLEDKRIEGLRRIAEASVSISTEKMLTTWCPLLDGNCQKKCVHFKSGYVFDIDFNGGCSISVPPTCKLWGGE